MSEPLISDDKPATYDIRIVAAAAHECVYVADNLPPACPEEWPGKPWMWCGACFAKELAKA